MTNERSTEIVKSLSVFPSHSLLAIHLWSGDIMLGELFDLPQFFKGFPLAFNTPAGEIFNNSAIAEIPYETIVAVSAVPIADYFYTSTQPMQYPNPLATIIYNHNEVVAGINKINVSGYVQRAFGSSAIAEGGISLADWFVFYSDYDGITLNERQPLSATITLPVVSFARTFNDTTMPRILEKLKEIKIYQHDLDIRSNNGSNLIGFNGILTRRLEENDEIEGEQCYVWEIAMIVAGIVETRLVLMKRPRLKYPLDFIHQLASELTFIAEPIPFPLFDSQGVHHALIYLARAVAYVPNDEAVRKR